MFEWTESAICHCYFVHDLFLSIVHTALTLSSGLEYYLYTLWPPENYFVI